MYSGLHNNDNNSSQAEFTYYSEHFQVHGFKDSPVIPDVTATTPITKLAAAGMKIYRIFMSNYEG